VSDLGKPIEPRGDELPTQRGYSRMVLNIALSISLVSVIPLVVLTWFNYNQYRLTLDSRSIRPMERMTEAARRSVHRVVAAHRGAMETATRECRREATPEIEQHLQTVCTSLNEAFGDFRALLLADEGGSVLARTDEPGADEPAVAAEEWFRVALEGRSHASEMFSTPDGRTAFFLSVSCGGEPGERNVLRATLEGELMERELALFEQQNQEAFIATADGVVQTPSRLFGPPGSPVLLNPPLDALPPGVTEAETQDGHPLFVGRADLEGTPFVLLLANHRAPPASWFERRHTLLFFTGVSIVLLVVVVTWGSRRIGARLRRSDVRRAAMYHHLEYTNKMAAIGRLGAGVAHEINNPLAIIGEKAGLMQDLMTIPGADPSDEKLLEQIGAIQTSVERCSKITHRLLGFAKHMEVRKERIELRHLLRQVLSFLDREAGYRSIDVHLDIPPSLPTITSDRGQLQQVFLNIINNAFAAVEEGGEIRITGEDTRDGYVVVHVEDDGVGIPEEHLRHVFEPFYTTKGGSGTGLGLSITYGIVEKHGGSIQVSSKVGEGTRFSVRLPLVEKD